MGGTEMCAVLLGSCVFTLVLWEAAVAHVGKGLLISVFVS